MQHEWTVGCIFPQLPVVELCGTPSLEVLFSGSSIRPHWEISLWQAQRFVILLRCSGILPP